jgi:hypothetical protein
MSDFYGEPTGEQAGGLRWVRLGGSGDARGRRGECRHEEDEQDASADFRTHVLGDIDRRLRLCWRWPGR